jgi:hypothetical protein
LAAWKTGRTLFWGNPWIGRPLRKERGRLLEERPGPRWAGAEVNRSSLTRLEEDLLRIPGVVGASLVGDDEVAEVHIVASNGRSAKQIVRDVQSLAAAGFGITIDHRVVSVVQLEDPMPTEDPMPSAESMPVEDPMLVGDPMPAKSENVGRPLVEMILTGIEDGRSWTRIRLRWSTGEATEGEAELGDSPRARARGAVSAVIRALNPALERLGARVDVEDVLLQPLGAARSVLVRVIYREGSKETEVLGSSVVHDDLVGAAVRAVLHALNRKLS